MKVFSIVGLILFGAIASQSAVLAGEPAVAVSVTPEQAKLLPDGRIVDLLEDVRNVALEVPTQENQEAYRSLQGIVFDRALAKVESNSFDEKRYAECLRVTGPAISLLRHSQQRGIPVQELAMTAEDAAGIAMDAALAQFAGQAWTYWHHGKQTSITDQNYGDLATFLAGFCYSNPDGLRRVSAVEKGR